MFVGIGWYMVKNDTFVHRRLLNKNTNVYVKRVVADEDIELSSVTIRLNENEQYVIPIKHFIKYYERIED